MKSMEKPISFYSALILLIFILANERAKAFLFRRSGQKFKQLLPEKSRGTLFGLIDRKMRKHCIETKKVFFIFIHLFFLFREFP